MLFRPRGVDAALDDCGRSGRLGPRADKDPEDCFNAEDCFHVPIAVGCVLAGLGGRRAKLTVVVDVLGPLGIFLSSSLFLSSKSMLSFSCFCSASTLFNCFSR